MRLRLLFLIYALSVLLIGAQSPAKILKQAERALGGAKNLKTVSSVVKTGKIKRPGDSNEGSYIIKIARPNLFYFMNDLDRESELGFNGRSGWIRESNEQLRTLTGDSSVRLQAKAAFRNSLWLNYKKDKSKLVPAGAVNLDGKRANTVILTTAKGVQIKLYFDATNGLLVRDEVPNAAFIEATDYWDYRDVQGVKSLSLRGCRLTARFSKSGLAT